MKYEIKRCDGLWRLRVVARDGWSAATYWVFEAWHDAIDFIQHGGAWKVI